MTFREWVAKKNDELFTTAGITDNVERQQVYTGLYSLIMGLQSCQQFYLGAMFPFIIVGTKKKNRFIVKLISLRQNRRGVSVCRLDKDKFDAEVAIAIAFAKYKGEPVYKTQRRNLSELSVGTVFMFSDGVREYEYVGYSKTRERFLVVDANGGQPLSVTDQDVYC